MKEQTYKQLFTYEQILYVINILLVPLGLFFILFFAIVSGFLSNPASIILFVLFPYSYAVIFLISYRKGMARWFLHKNSKIFFEKLGYPKAIIRLNFIHKILRYSIIALVIFGIISIISIQSMIQDMEKKEDIYFEKLDVYLEEFNKFEKMNETEIRSYFQERIDSMTIDELRNYVENIIRNEQESKSDSNSVVELNSPEEIVEKMTYDQLKNMALDDLNIKNLKALKNEISIFLNRTKPSLFLLNNEGFWSSVGFLVVLTSIPAAMVYTIFVLK